MTAKAGEAELLACLVLVAPSGMSADDRLAWICVARETLRGIPADLLQRGCQKARATCRFPSEIVPTIVEEVGPTWSWRRRVAAEEAQREANRNAPQLPEPECVRPEQMRALINALAKTMKP